VCGTAVPFDHTFNADFGRIEAFLERDAADTFKAGYEASAQVLKGQTFGEDGAKLSLSASFEKYRNVPDAKHETIAQASGRLDFPIAEGITLPMSVAYANHNGSAYPGRSDDRERRTGD
jgi:hypothetical protein